MLLCLYIDNFPYKKSARFKIFFNSHIKKFRLTIRCAKKYYFFSVVIKNIFE